MSSTIFSVNCSPVYLWVTGNKRPYAQVLTVTRSPSFIFSCLKFSFPVIVPTVDRYHDPVKKNKRFSKSKVISFSASPCTPITVFLSTIQHSISSRKLHQLNAMFFSLLFKIFVASNRELKRIKILKVFRGDRTEWVDKVLFSLCFKLSWWRPLSYRNQSIDLLRKSMDWFLYDNGLRHERVKFS